MPKSFLVFALTFVLGLSLITSCKTVNISSKAPDKAPPTAPNPTLQPSVINVPITFMVKQIETRLNQELNGVIYKDDNIEDDNLKMTITKNGIIRVTASDNKISFSIPLHIAATGRWQWEPCSICPKLSKEQSADFDIVINSTSTIGINENWQIETHTTGDYTWGDKKPSFNIGPVKIPVSGIIDLALKPEMDKISSWADQEIQKRVNIKDYVKKAWVAAQKPILVDKTYNTWLLMTPLEVSASGLRTSSDKISMTIGIKTLIETVSGDMPHYVINDQLPKLLTIDGEKNDFNVGISGEITYALASDILNKNIAGQTYTYDDGKYEIKVDSISLSGNADYALIRLDLEGKQKKGGKKDIKGTVYMQGVPYYDPADMSIKVKDLKYSVNTRNVLIKSANWLLKAGLENQMNKYMVFPIKDRLDETRKLIEASINSGYKINENATLKGSITSLEPQGLYLTSHSLKAMLVAKGKISIIVDKL